MTETYNEMMEWWEENFHCIPQSAFTLADKVFNLTDDDSEVPESYYCWVYHYTVGDYSKLTQEQL